MTDKPRATHDNPIIQRWLDTQDWLGWLPDSCARVNACMYIAAEAVKRGDIPDDVFAAFQERSSYLQRIRDVFCKGGN